MPSRSLDDILRDVIEALEPRETADPHSPLWVLDVLPNIHVDTGDLIDAAALGRGVFVDLVRGKTHVSAKCYRQGDRGEMEVVEESDSVEATTRDAVILALAEALGVETGEEE